MATDPREPILARLALLLSQVNLFEFAGRNLTETDELRTPSCILFDGDETAWDVPQATGARPGVVEMAPVIEITAQEPPETVGTSINAMVFAIKKKLLNDTVIENLCGEVTNGGIRYVATTTSLTPARAEVVKMLVHFTVSYAFTPKLY